MLQPRPMYIEPQVCSIEALRHSIYECRENIGKQTADLVDCRETIANIMLR